MVLSFVLIKLIYRIGGETYLQTNKNNDAAKVIANFISKDISGLAYKSNIIDQNTSTINLTLAESDESVYVNVRKVVKERVCVIIKNNQPQIPSLNINIYTSRSQTIIYSGLLNANKCI